MTRCKQSLSAALSDPTETTVHTDSGVTSVGLVTQIMSYITAFKSNIVTYYFLATVISYITLSSRHIKVVTVTVYLPQNILLECS